MKRLHTLALPAALAAAGAVAPAHAFQPPVGGYDRIGYYSDPGLNDPIGRYRIHCDQHAAHWGGISGYDREEYGSS